jgi:hypothetical protein
MESRIDGSKTWATDKPTQTFQKALDVITRHWPLGKQSEYKVVKVSQTGSHISLCKYIV